MAKFSCFVALMLVLGLFGTISAKAEVGDSTQCVLCEFVMKELDDYLGNNATEQEIKDGLEKICSFLPTTVQDECNTLVDDYAVEIIDLLVQGLSPSMVCKELGFCSSSQMQGKFPGPQCAICKEVLGKLADMLSSNATEAEIESDLEKACSLLPGTLEDECDQFVMDYTPTIIQLLTHEVAPEAICALLQLCSTKQEVVPPVKLEVEAAPTCALCEFVMKEVDSLLENNNTQAEIEAALDKVCSLLPSTIKSECDDFVKDYLPTLINLLVNDISPDQVCSLLKFCTSSQPKVVPLKQILLSKATKVEPKKVEVDPTLCSLCEFVIKEIDSLLTQNSTEEEIKKVVEGICPILPGTLKEQCVSFLDTYGPTLITLLVQQLDPAKICTAIGVCSKNKFLVKKDNKVITSHPSEGPVKANPEECALCEFALSELKNLISKNSTEAEIKAALDDVCNILPSSLKTTCLLFVNEYADVIVKLIANEIDPSQICTAIGLCQKTVVAADDECDLCQILVKFADDFIRDNKTEEEIVKGLLDICSILPSNLGSQCTNIINQYGTVIPGLIAEILDPLKVCEVLGICSQNKADLCSKGPSAWCTSMENAQMCNAVAHCKRHVWN